MMCLSLFLIFIWSQRTKDDEERSNATNKKYSGDVIQRNSYYSTYIYTKIVDWRPKKGRWSDIIGQKCLIIIVCDDVYYKYKP